MLVRMELKCFCGQDVTICLHLGDDLSRQLYIDYARVFISVVIVTQVKRHRTEVAPVINLDLLVSGVFVCLGGWATSAIREDKRQSVDVIGAAELELFYEDASHLLVSEAL